MASSVSASASKWRQRTSVRVALNIGVAVGGVVLARLLATGTQVLLARLMGVADFGLYTALFTLLGAVIAVTSLGLDTWLLRQGGNLASLGVAICQVFSLRLLATALLMAVAVIAILLRGPAGLDAPLVVLAALALTCELLLTTAYTALRAQIRNWTGALLQVAAAGLMVLLVWFFWNSQAPILSATMYRLISSAGALLLVGWVLRSTLHLVWRPRQLWGMLKQARVYFFSDVLAAISLKADLSLVALLVGALAAGIYSPALTIVNTTFLVPHVTWQVLLPVLARQPRGSRGFRRVVVFALGGSLLYGLFWAGALLWGAEWIVQRVYGEQYQGAVPLIQIMSLIPLLKSFNFCWTTIMIARDRQLLRTKLQAVGSIVNGLGNLAVIPAFGLLGAAWINLFTEIVLLACYSYGAWVTLRRPARPG